jgi:hypothetical protein
LCERILSWFCIYVISATLYTAMQTIILEYYTFLDWFLYITMLCYLQPIFPGESGVDQLVEIIKVNFLVSVSLCFISFFLKVAFCCFLDLQSKHYYAL